MYHPILLFLTLLLFGTPEYDAELGNQGDETQIFAFKETVDVVWYKKKFGSQNLATNFGVFFMIYVMFSQICSMWL